MTTPIDESTPKPVGSRYRKWLLSIVALVSMVGIFAAVVYASIQEEDPMGIAPSDLPKNAGITQQLNAQVPLDIKLRDEAGQVVELKDLLDGRPVILTLVYYQCPMLCNMTRDGQIRALSDLSMTAGKEFTALTVSFDHHETPELAAAAKRTALERYDRPGAAYGWRFLTGEEDQIRRLTEAVGFRFKFDQKTGQYAHAAGLIVLTPEGRVSRYLYGVEFPKRDLRLALVEASGGKIGSKTDQVMLLCFHYDPITGRYGLAIMNVLRLGGLATVMAIIVGITILIRRERTPLLTESDSLTRPE